MTITLASLALGTLLAATPVGPFTHEWHELAEGVYAGIRPDSTRTPVMGTTTLVVSDQASIVFDGGGVPGMAERVIEKLRELDAGPVTHVVVSHWHQDHNFGIKAYVDAYPGVRIVSHPYTRATLLMANAQFADQQAEAGERLRDSVATILERGSFADGNALTARDRARFERALLDVPEIGREYARIEPVYPDTTFESRMVLHVGDRVVELLHLGSGNTAGDIVMWLPVERVVAVGDLVVHPTPYGFGSHPGAWADTLRRVRDLDYAVLVPGHGDLQRDTRFIDLMIGTVDSISTQMTALVAAGASEEEAIGQLDFSAVESSFTNDDEFLAGRFRAWFARPIATAAWREANGLNPDVVQ